MPPRAKASNGGSGETGGDDDSGSGGENQQQPKQPLHNLLIPTFDSSGPAVAPTTPADVELERLLESAPLTSTATKNRSCCAALLAVLKRHRNHWVFAEPVDTVALKLHDYFDVIKQPMDLGTIGMKLRGGSYMTVMDLVEDLRLVWDNACAYNSADNEVHAMALELRALTEARVRELAPKLEACVSSRGNDDCAVCGQGDSYVVTARGMGWGWG